MIKRTTGHFHFFIITIFLCFGLSTHADPFFTGPILAPSGVTIPKGHTNVEFYSFETTNTGFFNRHWRHISVPNTTTQQFNPLLTFGLSDFSDIQLSFPYIKNISNGQSYHHIGDVSALLGLQLIRQKDSKWRPNLRVTIRQSVPTGQFEQFSPSFANAEITGSGSYETAVAMNFQLLTKINDTNYLRTRLILNYQYAAPVDVRGINTYGGNITTRGTVQPGHFYSVDLSGELTITKHWVAVMEGYYFYQTKTSFSGFAGVPVNNKIPVLSKPFGEEISLAPAVEYNFNAHLGVIAGVWFAVAGRSASSFRSSVIAINTYW